MILTLTLLCSLLVLASGSPLHANSHGFYDRNGYYHKGRARVHLQQQNHYSTGYTKVQAVPDRLPGEQTCQTARYTSTGEQGVTTVVHVCETYNATGKKSYCYITNGPCCALGLDSPNPTGRYQLTLETQLVNVDFYASFNGLGACYVLGTDVPACEGCQSPECTDIICIENTATGDDSTCGSGSCQCREGFAPPDCCECDLEGRSGQHHYLDPVTGECRPYCRMNCNPSSINETGCARCIPGFRPPDCCQCDTGYYNNQGICSPFCAGNTINGDASSCDADGCQCNEGFAGPDCCQCDPQHYRNPLTEQCEPFCAGNTINGDASSCDADGCQCNEGFAGPDCCQCDPQHYRNPLTGQCEPFCPGNTITGDASSCGASGCQCREGFAGDDCCDCDLQGVNGRSYYRDPETEQCLLFCPGNTITGDANSCGTGGCQCREGFAGDNCCECDLQGVNGRPHYRDPVTGQCEPFCANNTINGDASSCVTGVCQCREGFVGPGCCECAPQHYGNPLAGQCEPFCAGNTITGDASSCGTNGCQCRTGFAGHDCCQCDPQHYGNPLTGQCESFCAGNTINGDASSCDADGCQCNEGFAGRNCCTPVCTGTQDIYFVIDPTNSNNGMAFCQTQYGLELLIAALRPSNTISGTRISAILYPYAARAIQNPPPSEVNQPFDLFNLGTGCTEAVGKLQTIIDGVNIRTVQTNPYLSIRPQIINGRATYPVTAIQKVTETIEQGINNGEPSNRRRIVVVFTDGDNDQSESDLRGAVQSLTAISNSLTLIALGNTLNVASNNRETQFREQLRIIAGDNTVIGTNGLELARGLVRLMIQAGAICEDAGNELLERLDDSPSNEVNTFCRCISSALTNSRCTGPTSCGLGGASGTSNSNPWYFRSPNYNPSLYSQAASTQGTHLNKKKNELEEEILQAVEEVLQERLGRA